MSHDDLGPRDFAVWAPGHWRVRLRIHDSDHDMEPGTGGWWYAGVRDAPHGTDYAYLLDDDPDPLPDPRSRWQPYGVHGPSRVYDHAGFPWTDTHWTGRVLPGCVLYELHIGTFTPEGTFDAAIDRLDHLVALGVDLVELMPVNSFDGVRGWGYDGVLWGAVHEPYGGPDGLKRLVDACHGRGLGVVLDVVYNHLGPSGSYLPRYGPYIDGQGTWGPSLNLDGPGSDEVRAYIIDNAVEWLRDYHLDGLRLDAVHALRDTRAVHLLAELSAEVDALAVGLRRPFALIAESDRNDPRTVTSREAGGLGMTAQWSDDLHHALHSSLTGETQGYYADFGTPDALPRTLRRAFLHDGGHSSFRGHAHGAPVDLRAISGARFLGYLQNHDQVGNRARGDRISATISPDAQVCGAALVLCSPYTPMLFMGEEWAASTPWQFFASFTDPELAEGVRQGRRREFAEHGWAADTLDVPDPVDPATRDRSVLFWQEREHAPHRAVLETYRALIALRHAHPELSDPRLDRFRVDAADDGRVLVLHRGTLRVACNLRSTPAVAVLDRPAAAVLLASQEARTDDTIVDLPAESFAVISTRAC